MAQEGKMSWIVSDALDYKGSSADRSKTGGWIPAALILGMLSLFKHQTSYMIMLKNQLIKNKTNFKLST